MLPCMGKFMSEIYSVKVELEIMVRVVDDSSSPKNIAEYIEKHLKNVLTKNYELAHNREIQRVIVDYCKAEEI